MKAQRLTSVRRQRDKVVRIFKPQSIKMKLCDKII